MYDLAVLEATFAVETSEPASPAGTTERGAQSSATDGYDQRLRSLLCAKGGRYERCLNGEHDYPSDSEASMAVVDAMVARHFSDGEIWRTLEGSTLFKTRVENKGERHARELYVAETEKAREQVAPFDVDPGAGAERKPTGGSEPRQQDLESDLPEIIVTDEHLRSLSAAAWSALEGQNHPPRLFQHGAHIAEVRRDEYGRHLIRDLSSAAVKGRLDRAANWLRTTRAGLVPARPPKDVIEDMMALEKPLPILRGIVGTPVFQANGELGTEIGFQRQTGLFYVPVGEAVPAVPQVPTEGDLARAREILIGEWLHDFPFVDDASRANAVAATITPLAREMIDGPTPLGALDAPSPGTGKGLLAETMSIIVSGASPAVMNDARSEEEVRKRITSLLREGHPMVLIDNVKRRLESPTLAALLTSTVWADRLLGGNELARLPNRSQWLVTGNNLDFDREIARRTIWIRLDSRADRPWEREGFRHNPLAGWVHVHRHDIVWSLLVIVQNWVASGRPRWSGKPLGSFEAWCDLIGGALVAAGIDGFLANRDDLYQKADRESEEWRSFVLAWWDAFGISPVKASQLLAMVQRDQLLLTLFATARDNATERSLVTRLGTALAARRDRRFGDYFIRVLGQDGHTKGTLYRLEQATQEQPHAEPSTGPAQGPAEVPHENRPFSDSNAEPAEPAEPETHAEVNRDQGPLLPLQEAEERVSSPTAFEVPQVPHVPQTDSKQAGLDAGPWPEQASEVPHEVPQPEGEEFEWDEEIM